MGQMEQLEKLTNQVRVARQRAADAKQAAKEAKEELERMRGYLERVAYNLSHGIADLPFDEADEITIDVRRRT